MLKKLPGWLIAAIIIAILIGAKFIFFAKKEEKKGGPSQKNNAPVVVAYTIAESNSFREKIYSSGRIGAFNEIQVKPEISGRLVTLHVKEGQEVKKGTLLAKLNDADIQAQLLKNKVQQKQCSQQLERLRKLLQLSGVSQEEFEQKENELDMLKAEQAFFEAQLQKTMITAPFSGRVGLKQVSEGEMVTANQMLFSLVQHHPVFIDFYVPEKYAGKIADGTNIEFSTEGSTKPLKAKVYASDARMDETTQSLRIRAEYNGNEALLPGSFVKVFTNFTSDEPVVMIPTRCIVPVLKGQKVFKAQNGKALEVMIKTGFRTDDAIQITEGVQPGDTVITTGLMMIKDGADIKLKK